ncbi:LicD family protein [Rheinheimera soli]|uniref:LicD/FKTN/FKRP nucleotidyltransferase domain-containing protein n=1 Tax=Rheinheimera soli TaxID=443616 RepID=A0ABU1VUF4_9GAMM|nr:LicD family protein [Rheinheimera soli]MDR7119215.1 hypothetical protein [Rheinheimera soli]
MHQPTNNTQTAYIYGAGAGGQKALPYYAERYHILGFIDSNESRQGDELCGLTIFAPAVLLRDQSLVLIASEYAEQIEDYLLNQLKLSKNRVIRVPVVYMKGTLLSDPHYLQLAQLSLTVLHQHLSAAAIRYHLEAGTLLGLYRDGQLIPWDTDLDLAFDAQQLPEMEAVLPQVIHELNQRTSLNYQLFALETHYEFGPVKPGMLRSYQIAADNGKAPAIDLFAKYQVGDKLYWSLASRGMTASASSLSRLSTLSYLQTDFLVPADTAAYLTNMYGDWQKPAKDWSIADCKNTQVY